MSILPLRCLTPKSGNLRAGGMRNKIAMKLLSVLTTAAAFMLAACDSEQEQAREQALENRAERLEDQAKVTQDAAKAEADATKRAADAQAEALKEQADRTREQK